VYASALEGASNDAERRYLSLRLAENEPPTLNEPRELLDEGCRRALEIFEVRPTSARLL